MAFERYAIYWAPRPGTPLAEVARAWLGGDVETGEAVEPSLALALDPDLRERAVRSPRRYALHATMKAPFRLREDVHEADVAEALAAYCSRRRRISTGHLRLHRFSRYLALVPSSDAAELHWLADECVTHFDRFRAPLNDADRARRSEEMTPRSRMLLEEFGYPLIFERFMFHITLAGPLEAAELDIVEAALQGAIAPLTEEPFAVEDLCLFGDPGRGAAFKLIARSPLRV